MYTKYFTYCSLFSLLLFLFLACDSPPSPVAEKVEKGVEIPAGKRFFISSGQVSPPNHLDQPEKTLARYGDTYTQSKGILNKMDGILKEAGLGLKDVVYLGVFIAPDPNKNGEIDFDAWFKAYGEFFNNEQNPTKVARTTLGVAALARDYLLIEVEAIAVYPN